MGTGAAASDPGVAQLEAAAQAPPGQAGAPGTGDPHFPLFGNAGYDVRHHDLSLAGLSRRSVAPRVLCQCVDPERPSGQLEGRVRRVPGPA